MGDTWAHALLRKHGMGVVGSSLNGVWFFLRENENSNGNKIWQRVGDNLEVIDEFSLFFFMGQHACPYFLLEFLPALAFVHVCTRVHASYLNDYLVPYRNRVPASSIPHRVFTYLPSLRSHFFVVFYPKFFPTLFFFLILNIYYRPTRLLTKAKWYCFERSIKCIFFVDEIVWDSQMSNRSSEIS